MISLSPWISLFKRQNLRSTMHERNAGTKKKVQRTNGRHKLRQYIATIASSCMMGGWGLAVGKNQLLDFPHERVIPDEKAERGKIQVPKLSNLYNAMGANRTTPGSGHIRLYLPSTYWVWRVSAYFLVGKHETQATSTHISTYLSSFYYLFSSR